jgi:hypothetical protein
MAAYGSPMGAYGSPVFEPPSPAHASSGTNDIEVCISNISNSQALGPARTGMPGSARVAERSRARRSTSTRWCASWTRWTTPRCGKS